MVRVLTALALLALVLPLARGVARVQDDDRAVSPFSALRWPDERAPEVEVGGRFFRLVAIDEVEASELVEFAQREFGSLWRKRIEEDLPLVLSRVGSRAGDAVDLRLRDLESGEVVTRTGVAMTGENRRRIREAAQQRAGRRVDDDEFPKLAPFTAVRIEDGVPVARVGERWLRLETLDGIPVARIVDHIRRTQGPDRVRKRFAEDLVQMLMEMDTEPGATVELVGLDVETGERVTLPDVPMTAENRRAAWRANQAARTDAETVQRVEREHGTRVPRSYQRLRQALVTDPGHASGTLTRAQMQADLDQLEWLVRHRYAYRDRVGVDVATAFDAVRMSLSAEMARADFALQVTKLLGLFGDGHTRVSGGTGYFPAGYLPCLFEDAREGVVAFRADRTDFLIENRPFVQQIDGLLLERWLEAAHRLHPTGSDAYVRQQALGNLRYLTLMRAELGLAQKETVELLLTDGARSATTLFEFPVAAEKPIYGEWPRTDHRRIDGRFGYLRVPTMDAAADYLARLEAAMRSVADTDGLVIDVRGNGGGSREALRRLFGWFLSPDDPPHVVNVAAYRLHEGDDAHAPEGHLQNRFLWPAASERWSEAERAAIAAVAREFQPGWTPPAGEFSDWHYMVLSRDPALHGGPYTKPVVVLQDGGCFSATDVFLGAFATLPRVTLAGTPSGGGSGRARGWRLAHSQLDVRLSSMASFRPDGTPYDGVGIAPDVVLEPAASDWLGIGDTVLDRAVELLR